MSAGLRGVDAYVALERAMERADELELSKVNTGPKVLILHPRPEPADPRSETPDP